MKDPSSMGLYGPGSVEDLADWHRNASGIEIALFLNAPTSDLVSASAAIDKTNPGRSVIVDLRLVVGIYQLAIAAHRAASASAPPKSGSVANDVFYYLSPSTKISDAINHLRVSSEKTHADIAIISIAPHAATVPTSTSTHSPSTATLPDLRPIYASISVHRQPLAAFPSPPEPGSERYQQVSQFYKLISHELLISSLEDAVLSKLATKEFLK
jgi:hypothetical protein